MVFSYYTTVVHGEKAVECEKSLPPRITSLRVKGALLVKWFTNYIHHMPIPVVKYATFCQITKGLFSLVCNRLPFIHLS